MCNHQLLRLRLPLSAGLGSELALPLVSCQGYLYNFLCVFVYLFLFSYFSTGSYRYTCGATQRSKN